MTSLSGYFKKIVFLSALIAFPFVANSAYADHGGGHGGGGGGHMHGGGGGWHNGGNWHGGDRWHGNGYHHHGYYGGGGYYGGFYPGFYGGFYPGYYNSYSGYDNYYDDVGPSDSGYYYDDSPGFSIEMGPFGIGF